MPLIATSSVVDRPLFMLSIVAFTATSDSSMQLRRVLFFNIVVFSAGGVIVTIGVTAFIAIDAASQHAGRIHFFRVA